MQWGRNTTEMTQQYQHAITPHGSTMTTMQAQLIDARFPPLHRVGTLTSTEVVYITPQEFKNVTSSG